ncbi:dDE family endonuclease [Candidatus Magnetomorum sp. HK-1]|nr:dDE family endonuclease [Candidatus Magnetomorum sp. HK-1]
MLNISYNFSNFEIEQLKLLRDQSNNYRLRERILSIILFATLSISIIQISEIIGKSQKTIENWITMYLNEGIDSLRSYNYKTKKPLLNYFQKNQIKIFVTFEIPETIKEIIHYIDNKFKIKYSREGVKKILNELGLKRLRLKTVPGNPPTVEDQKQFIKRYEELRKKPDSVTLFGDAMHLIHQNLPGYCWCDPSHKPIIETNSGRKRLNILGAYNPGDKSFLHISNEENCNAERVIDFLSLISEKYKKSPKVYIIVDNARYFHALLVQEWLEQNDHIQIIFLPTYSPNLNLIERFFKYAKKQLVVNKYYKTYKEFRAKTFQFLNNVKDHIENLEPLMVEKFQII